MPSDNEKCVKLVNELMEVSSMFGYGEVNAHSRYSTLMSTYKNISNPIISSLCIERKTRCL